MIVGSQTEARGSTMFDYHDSHQSKTVDRQQKSHVSFLKFLASERCY